MLLLSSSTSCEVLAGKENKMPGVRPSFRNPVSLWPVNCLDQAVKTSSSAYSNPSASQLQVSNLL